MHISGDRLHGPGGSGTLARSTSPGVASSHPPCVGFRPRRKKGRRRHGRSPGSIRHSAERSASVSSARTYVGDVLAEWGMPRDAETADTVRLIVSELATNAVMHTRGQSPVFTVDVQLERDEHLRIGVTDSHPRYPKRLPAAVQQDNGRGMVIIRWLTAECGGSLSVRPTPKAARPYGSPCRGRSLSSRCEGRQGRRPTGGSPAGMNAATGAECPSPLPVPG